MTVSYIDPYQRAYGPPSSKIPGNPVQYFINPVGIQSIILSAIELSKSTVLTTDALQAFSINAHLAPQVGSQSVITYPLVQGMGFITAIYRNLMPSIQSAVFFRSLVKSPQTGSGIFKYQLTLEDGKSWLLYAIPNNGQDPQLQLVSSSQIQGTRGWNGTIQVSHNNAGQAGETIYDISAGVYPIGGNVVAGVSGATGTYRLGWTKGGVTSKKLLMFALPHHVATFDSVTASQKTNLRLQTTSKGIATAVYADIWTLVEPSLPIDMTFAPWTPNLKTKSTFSTNAANIIKQVAASEVSQNMNAQTYLDSMYFSGKALSKFAMIVYTIHDLLHEPDFAAMGLEQLKGAFAKFVTNQQIYPLVYDSKWGGIVSSATYQSKDPNQDFGNTYYNDHHFHYGKDGRANLEKINI